MCAMNARAAVQIDAAGFVLRKNRNASAWLFCLLLTIVVVFGASRSAHAATIEDCNSDEPHKMISGCSALLQQETDPEVRVPALIRRGVARKDKSDFKEANADFSEALQLSPRMPVIFVLRGETYVSMRQLERAASDFAAALKIDPKNSQAIADMRSISDAIAIEKDSASGAAPAPQTWIGVKLQSVTEEIARTIGLGNSRGAMIAAISPDGPAALAKLLPGDVILSYDGKPVEQSPQLLGSTPPDKRIDLKIWRDGQEYDVDFKTGARDPGQPSPPPDVAAYCHVERGPWLLGSEYHRFIAITAGYTCQFTYNADFSPSKMVLSTPSKGKLKACGPLCWIYRPEVTGQDRFTVEICRTNGKSAELGCDSGPQASTAKITYEIKVENPLFWN